MIKHAPPTAVESNPKIIYCIVLCWTCIRETADVLSILHKNYFDLKSNSLSNSIKSCDIVSILLKWDHQYFGVRTLIARFSKNQAGNCPGVCTMAHKAEIIPESYTLSRIILLNGADKINKNTPTLLKLSEGREECS